MQNIVAIYMPDAQCNEMPVYRFDKEQANFTYKKGDSVFEFGIDTLIDDDLWFLFKIIGEEGEAWSKLDKQIFEKEYFQ